MQNFSKENQSIDEGALYRRGVDGVMSEIAEVVEIGRDRMGIPHVRFNAYMMRGNYAASGAEQRTLAVESFFARYRERVQKAN